MAAVEKILLQFEADIKDLKSELGDVKKQLGNVEKQTEQTGSKMTNTFKNIGKAIAGAFAIREVVRFGQEAIRLAATLEGVERAFNRISNPGLLEDLRKQTKGTVSDLELMQNAVKASNFQIPLDQLGKLFAFAQQRARETGESVDYLVDSIVLGIGRKSPLILDNLGISAVRLRSEFKGLGVETAEVGDVAAAVGRIIDEEMGNAGETMITTADKMAAMNATFKNFQAEIGEDLLPLVEVLIGALEDIGIAAVFAQDKMFEFFAFLGSQKAKQKLANDAQKEYYDALVEEGLELEDLTKKLKDLQKERDIILKARQGEGTILEEENKKANKYYKSLGDKLNTNKDQMEAVNALIAAMSNNLSGEGGGSGLNDELDDLNKKVLDLSESLDVLPKILSDIYDPLSELPGETERWRAALSRLLGDVENNDGIADFYKGIEDAIEDADDANVKFFETLTNNPDPLDNLLRGLSAAQTLFGTYSQLLLDTANNQSAVADFGRQLAFFEIASAQAVAVANAVKVASASSKTPIDYFVFLATILSSIGVTIGKAKSLIEGQSAPLPAFAEGVVDLQGKGTETSDSIFAKLSKGESVITAKGTRQDKGLFEAANKLELESYIKENYILPALKEKKQRDDVVYDDYRIYLAMMNNQRAVKDGSRDIVKAIGRRNKRYDWT